MLEKYCTAKWITHKKMNFIISTASILGKKCKMQNRHCNDNASETEEKTKTENCVYAHTFE